MKKIVSTILTVITILGAFADDVWEIRIEMDVPRVFNNTNSRGYRKYQKQTIIGFFRVDDDQNFGEPEIEFFSMKNITHKVNGRNVTYDVRVDSVGWHGIGSNATGIFNTRACVIALIAEPSYAIGPDPTEDNALMITLSGKGSETYISGFVSGQIGCGCKDYGHISPTRIWKTDTVVDAAATFGKWKARKKYVICR